MSLKNINPTKTFTWKKLNDHFKEIKDNSIKSYFQDDNLRAENFTIKWEDFYVDFSKNRINNETLDLFNELLDQVELKDAINKYFSGHLINKTENRAVLHTALRAKNDHGIVIDGEEIFSPAVKINPVDTNGAGDMFAGSFMHAYLNGFDIETCAEFSNYASSKVVETFGPRLTPEGYEEVSNKLRKN